MSGICYIVGAGEHFENDIFSPAPDDMVIAADGGYEFLKKNNIRTDIILGDFDSLSEKSDLYEKNPDSQIIKLNPVKDETDTLSAINTGIENGFTVFYIYGGTGGRTEHTMANIQSLTMLAKRGMCGYLFSANEILTVIHNSDISFDSNSKGYISVFSLDTESYNVSEKGFRYTLNNYTMSNTYPIGVSNEFAGQKCSVSVGNGTLLVVYSRNIQKNNIQMCTGIISHQ